MSEQSSITFAYAEGTTGQEGVRTLSRFRFEGGAVIDAMRVGYVTHGRLNAQCDNVVLVPPGTGNTRHSFDGYIGPGKAIDTTRYFVIAVDAIGGGTSSQPRDDLGSAFPRYTIRDMVRVQHEFLEQAFGSGVFPLHAVVGASMGAFQALEWAVQYPDRMRNSVLIVPAARIGNVFKTVARQMIEIIELDRRWNGGEYQEPPIDGLRAAGRFYYPWTVTDAFINSLSADALERELSASAARFEKWDAWALIRRYQASSSHDVSMPFGGDIGRALANVRARTLVMPTSTDRLIGLAAAREIAEHVRNARYVEIPSPCGHFGWRPIEGAQASALIARETQTFLQAGA